MFSRICILHNDDKNIGLGKIEIVRMNSIYNSEIIKIEEEGKGENMYNEYKTYISVNEIKFS